MAAHTIQFKGWQMGTWFTVDESDIDDEESELKLLLQSTSGTKVKVRLDKSGLKVTKMTVIPFIGSEKTPLRQIKNIYINPKFPSCFFCTSSRPDGYLMKIIMIRCTNEMCATGIVNYYQTLTFKKPANSNPIIETTPENVTANVQTAVVSTANDENKDQTVIDGKQLNNGDEGMNANDNNTEKITPTPKKAETSEALNAAIEAAPATRNGIEMKDENLKILSKEVEAIQEQTLKKHPATISRQEYIDAHEKVHRLATELSKQGARTTDPPSKNPRHYSMVYTQVDRAQLKKPGNTIRIYQPSHNRYLLVNNDGNVVPVARTRAQTINGGNIARMPRQERPNSILRSSKENEEIKARTLPIKSVAASEAIADSTDGRSAPISREVAATEPQEPIYARVMKNRTNKDGKIHTNGDTKLYANHSDNGTYSQIRVVNTPPVPHRTVTFKKWSVDVQKRTSKKGQRPAARPNSYHQHLQPLSVDMMTLNTHVPKRIENVYYNTLGRTWNLNEQYRPRVNSNTFRDNKHRAALYTEVF